MIERKYFSPEEVEQRYGIPQGTLTQWRHHGKGPAYHKFGRSVRYAVEDLEAWVKGQRVMTTDVMEMVTRHGSDKPARRIATVRRSRQ